MPWPSNLLHTVSNAASSGLEWSIVFLVVLDTGCVPSDGMRGKKLGNLVMSKKAMYLNIEKTYFLKKTER